MNYTIERTARLTVVAIAVFAFLLHGCSGGNILVVNDEGIEESRYLEEVERRLEVVRKDHPEELEGSRGENLVAETRRQVATDLIKAKLMKQQAHELGLEIPADEVDRQIEKERNERGADEFLEELESQGLTEGQYREALGEQYLVDELAGKVCEGVKVTDDEVESFYLTNKGLFSHTAMVHAAHILLDTEGKATMVWEQLEEGADFDRLAASFSRDMATKSNGGDLGWIEQGTMDPAFEQTAFSLQSGQVSGVVEASDGFHIIKVIERREAYTPSYDEVKHEARQMLLNRKKEEEFSDWLRTVYANAEVEVPSSIGKWDPRLGMVVAS